MTKDFKTLIDEATEKLAKDSSFHANVNSKVIVQSIFHDGASLPNELLLKALEALEKNSKLLDGIKSELNASVYTLTDDEFEMVYHVRDLSDIVIAEIRQRLEESKK